MMKKPSVLYECYTMSQYLFLLLLILNSSTKSANNEYLGAPPTIYEVLIWVWGFGKIVEESYELYKKGWKNYQRDLWNFADVILILFFLTWFVMRAVDLGLHYGDENKVYRIYWPPNELRLVSVEISSIFYFLSCLRALGYARMSRLLGSMRLTLSKMMEDLFRVSCFFIYIMLAFCIGINELFWFYGTPEATNKICSRDCYPSEFYNLGMTTVNLYWATFGYINPMEIDFNMFHKHVETMGLILFAVYHIALILLLINIGIAMMSKTYEKFSANQEEEWRFHQAVIRLTFIRGDLTCPPPMNLLPNPNYIYKKIKQLCNHRRTAAQLPTFELSHNTNSKLLSSVTAATAPQDSLMKWTAKLVRHYKKNKISPGLDSSVSN